MVPTKSRLTNQETETTGFYKTFLANQIDELQNKIDDVDYEFVIMTSQTLELSKQVKELEGEIAANVEMIRNTPSFSPNLEKLSNIARMSNAKLSAARSQLGQAMIAKSERFKRLEELKKEMEEK